MSQRQPIYESHEGQIPSEVFELMVVRVSETVEVLARTGNVLAQQTEQPLATVHDLKAYRESKPAQVGRMSTGGQVEVDQPLASVTELHPKPFIKTARDQVDQALDGANMPKAVND